MTIAPDANTGAPPGMAPLKIRRAKTPTLLQMEATECGAAALGIVLGYHGRHVPLEELRAACAVSRDGSKASNVLRAGRAYGLDAHGYRAEPHELAKYTAPFIVFWNFNHFVVAEGFDGSRVYINDPAVGPRTVTYDEFDRAFTGVILTLEPTAEFRRGGKTPRLVAQIAARLPGSRTGLLFCVLTGIALVVPGLAIPAASKVFVDGYLDGGQTEWIAPLIAGMALAAILRAGLTWLQLTYLLRFNTKLALEMASSFFWHVLRLPMGFFSQRYAGDISFRVGLNDSVAQLLSGQLTASLANIAGIGFYAALMFYYDVPLTLIGILFAALNIAALQFVSRSRVDLSHRLLQEQGKLVGTAMNGLQIIETLKATGSESDFFSRWAGFQAKVTNARQQLGVPTQVLIAVPPLLAALNTAAIIAFGGYRVMTGAITLGTLVAFHGLMVSFSQPISTLVGFGTQLQQIHSDLGRLDDVLRNEIDPALAATENRDTISDPKLDGALELRGVTFGYSRLDPPLIEDLHLTVEPGQRVAVVGLTGSGKSTLAKLVCGLLEPWNGEILFDGTSRSEIPRAVLTSSLAMVDQEIFLFDGSVEDNITLWNPTVPPADVVQAAKDARIHDDIAARPAGYASHVEEGGRNFSGGQAQRMEIARALASNPSIVVLDEATSALDPLTESEIDRHLRRRGCTCLIVAHRLSTIRDCDEIIVLDHGKVAQRGTHASMKDIDGPYAQLIAS
jgi:NHLM bacteriocin system ABC transporter peptidase/ATP-binding protein